MSTTIPLLGRTLPPFHQGAVFEFGSITLTVAATLPDPNTWTYLALVVHDEGGTDAVCDSADAATPVAISGSGPWTVTAYFPMSQAASSALTTGTKTFRVVFETATGRDVLVEGSVRVLEMHSAEWV